MRMMRMTTTVTAVSVSAAENSFGIGGFVKMISRAGWEREWLESGSGLSAVGFAAMRWIRMGRFDVGLGFEFLP